MTVRAAPHPDWIAPRLLAHADWSGARTGFRAKRQAVVARREGAVWQAGAPQPVAAPLSWLEGLLAEARGGDGTGSGLVGVDFPIGLPFGFASAHLGELAGFVSFLDRIAVPGGEAFLEPARSLDEVSPSRPFFPAGQVRGEGLRALHAARIGLAPSSLLRDCDQGGPQLRPACGLFWTLGGNQVGKAAASGWRELLVPGRARFGRSLRIWPFDGPLAPYPPGSLTIAETYPAEAYPRIGIPSRTAKRDPGWRQAQAPLLLAWAARFGILPEPDLLRAIETGFGPTPDGEDGFDATLALFGMVPVALGLLADGAPDRPSVRLWEGWMLGRQDDPFTRIGQPPGGA